MLERVSWVVVAVMVVGELSARADDPKEALARCLHGPITPRTVAHTNPWPAHTSTWEGLLAAATSDCAPPANWQACMGMNARLWPDVRVEQDYDDFERAVLALPMIVNGPPRPRLTAPSHWFEQTREFCLSAGQTACIRRLTSHVDYAHRTSEEMPRLFAYEDAAMNADAARQRDDGCHRQWDAQVAAAAQAPAQLGAKPPPHGPAPGAAPGAIAPPAGPADPYADEHAAVANANATAAAAQAAGAVWNQAAPELAQVASQAPDLPGRIAGSFEATFPIGGFLADKDGVSFAFPFRLQARLFKWLTSTASFERDEPQHGVEVALAAGYAPSFGNENLAYATVGARYWHDWFGVGGQLVGSSKLATAALQLSVGSNIAQRRGSMSLSIALDPNGFARYHGYASIGAEMMLKIIGFTLRVDKFEDVGVILIGMKVGLPW